MAQVQIYRDETYHDMIFRVKEEDNEPFPPLYLPIDIPDEVLEAYELSVRAEKRLRDWIIKTYGESPRNPEYEVEWSAFMESTRDDSTVDRYAEEANSVWAEYLGDDDT